MIKYRYFTALILIALAFLSGMYVSTGKRMRVPPDTVMVFSTMIWSDTMGDGCFMDGEFLPEATVAEK